VKFSDTQRKTPNAQLTFSKFLDSVKFFKKSKNFVEICFKVCYNIGSQVNFAILR
jgi:hypothetical protein